MEAEIKLDTVVCLTHKNYKFPAEPLHILKNLKSSNFTLTKFVLNYNYDWPSNTVESKFVGNGESTVLGGASGPG